LTIIQKQLFSLSNRPDSSVSACIFTRFRLAFVADYWLISQTGIKSLKLKLKNTHGKAAWRIVHLI